MKKSFNYSDWDGVNEYEQIRATMFTIEQNYIGFAADIYGATLQNVTEFDQRSQLATLYRNNTSLFVGRIQAAIDTVKTIPNVDPNNIALVGYVYFFSPYSLS
jgi:dienelactone hydrolase